MAEAPTFPGLGPAEAAAAVEVIRAELARREEVRRTDWAGNARAEQLSPPGDWRTWLILAGRGWGKTRTGAETVRDWITRGYRRIALVAPTAADARDVMVEGESGVLNVHPGDQRPLYEPSKRRVTWPNGAIATVYSADEPDRLRGPQHDAAWADEIAAWRRADDAWSNLMMGLRLGRDPRVIVTTTPRPIPIVRSLVAAPGTHLTRGRTVDNADNLAPQFLEEIMARYAGTRLGRQELDAEILEDTPGAFWSLGLIDRTRVHELPEMERIVVAVDPAVTNSKGSDFTAIVVVGLGKADRHVYVLEAQAVKETPEGWAQKVWAAYDRHGASRVIAEQNQGGQMVTSVLRQVRPSGIVRLVAATKSKSLRAEPIAHLYELGRVHHYGVHRSLEDQMAVFPVAAENDDLVDALTHGVTELIGPNRAPIVIGRGVR
jgi:predicted phage terminase large subunit-like protein